MTKILQHHEDGVLTLTFNRVERKNCIDVAMYDALATALEETAGDAETRAMLIQGDETVFSAGNDLEDFLNNTLLGHDSPGLRFLRAISTYPKPLLAAVCGPAIGVGTTMLLHCDLVYAGDNAVFSMPFVDLGLCPEAAATLLAPRMFGYHRAAEALLLGASFSAEEALSIGLVNRVVAPKECKALALAQARKMASKPLSTLIITKQLMKSGQQDAVQRQIDAEITHFVRLLGEPAARKAMTAFMEKRKNQ